MEKGKLSGHQRFRVKFIANQESEQTPACPILNKTANVHELYVPVMLATQPPLHRKKQLSQGYRRPSFPGRAPAVQPKADSWECFGTDPAETPREPSQSFPASAVSWEDGCPTDVLRCHISGALSSTKRIFLLIGDPIWNGH